METQPHMIPAAPGMYLVAEHDEETTAHLVVMWVMRPTAKGIDIVGVTTPMLNLALTSDEMVFDRDTGPRSYYTSKVPANASVIR